MVLNYILGYADRTVPRPQAPQRFVSFNNSFIIHKGSISPARDCLLVVVVGTVMAQTERGSELLTALEPDTTLLMLRNPEVFVISMRRVVRPIQLLHFPVVICLIGFGEFVAKSGLVFWFVRVTLSGLYFGRVRVGFVRLVVRVTGVCLTTPLRAILSLITLLSGECIHLRKRTVHYVPSLIKIPPRLSKAPAPPLLIIGWEGQLSMCERVCSDVWVRYIWCICWAWVWGGVLTSVRYVAHYTLCVVPFMSRHGYGCQLTA